MGEIALTAACHMERPTRRRTPRASPTTESACTASRRSRAGIESRSWAVHQLQLVRKTWRQRLHSFVRKELVICRRSERAIVRDAEML